MNSYNEHSEAELIDCICPKCGKKHKRLENYTGGGTARYFCWDCMSYMKTYNIQIRTEQKLKGVGI